MPVLNVAWLQGCGPGRVTPRPMSHVQTGAGRCTQDCWPHRRVPESSVSMTVVSENGIWDPRHGRRCPEQRSAACPIPMATWAPSSRGRALLSSHPIQHQVAPRGPCGQHWRQRLGRLQSAAQAPQGEQCAVWGAGGALYCFALSRAPNTAEQNMCLFVHCRGRSPAAIPGL